MLSTNCQTLCANTKTRKLGSKSSLTGTFTMLESKPLLFSNKCYLSMQQRKGYSFFLRSFKWLLSKVYLKNFMYCKKKIKVNKCRDRKKIFADLFIDWVISLLLILQSLPSNLLDDLRNMLFSIILDQNQNCKLSCDN